MNASFTFLGEDLQLITYHGYESKGPPNLTSAIYFQFFITPHLQSYQINECSKLPAAFTITTIQSTSSENTKTGKSFVSGPTFPGPISSRFLDLGGVISQLFPGFNQGAPGGSPGLNFPPNSQFYPDVLAQVSEP